MNKKIIIIVFLSIVTVLFAQQGIGKYDFPIKPGTAEWKNLASYEEKHQVCQIPKAILGSMLTNDLLETCLDYPLLPEILAYDSFQKGFESIKSRFNGLEELLKRKDVGNVIIKKYESMDPSAIDSNWTSIRKGKHSFDFFFIELLLAQDEVISNMTNEERMQLLKDSNYKFKEKEKHQDIFGFIGFTNNILLMGRIMLKENYKPFVQAVSLDSKLNKILQDALPVNGEEMEKIIKHVKQCINEN